METLKIIELFLLIEVLFVELVWIIYLFADSIVRNIKSRKMNKEFHEKLIENLEKRKGEK